MNSPIHLLLYLTIASQLLAPLALWHNPSRDPGRRAVTLLCLLWFGFDVAGLTVGFLSRSSNLWLEYLLDPVQAIVVFLLLDRWQTTWMARLALRFLLPGYLLSVVVLGLLLDNPEHLSVLTSTVTSCVLLGIVLYTLTTRARAEVAVLRSQDWFWFCLGLALYYGLEAALNPVLRHLLGRVPASHGFLILAQVTRLAGTTVAMMLLARGMRLKDSSDLRVVSAG